MINTLIYLFRIYLFKLSYIYSVIHLFTRIILYWRNILDKNKLTEETNYGIEFDKRLFNSIWNLNPCYTIRNLRILIFL